MKYKLSAALLGAVCTHAYAVVDETLPDIVVTATRTAQSADAALASVSIITRQDIARLQAQSLPDVLRGVAGLTLSNNGGAGKATSVFLRGTNADHVLVLVDGIKVGSATTGTASFQDIPVAQIERIEIVRGPRASLYGSEAIGGVIQIFTRKGGGALTPSFSATAGSYGTVNGMFGLSGGGEQGWFNAKVDQQNIKGFNAKRNATGADLDKDGYHNSSFGLNGGYRFDNGVIADAHALRANSKNQYDAGGANENKDVQQVLGGSLKFAPMQAWNMTLRAGRSLNDSNDLLNGVSSSIFNTQRDSLSWQNDIALDSRQLISAGLDYQNDRVDSTTAYAQTARSNKALFGQYQGGFGAHSLEASLRRDNNQQFGGHNTGGLGYSYAINDATRLTASYGTAFKAPTFNNLFWPFKDYGVYGSYVGNPNLRPEQAKSSEVGFHYTKGRQGIDVVYFDNRIRDLIASNGLLAAMPINLAQVRINGLEAQFKTEAADWGINGTLTLQDPRQASGANQGKLLNRRATEAMRIEVARGFGAYRIASSLYAEGRRFDDIGNTKRLGGYGLLDVRAEYRIAADWLVQGRIDNLLDKQYETAQFYNQAGRGLYFTLNYQPGS
ncbi:MAG: TonB-dependent vitamin B12 receptor [Gallionella sp.]|nr:TonB-dependent vitamin B12 receptor [Gallionella sp.]